MRWRLAAGLGLGLGLAHACGDEGFSCDDDEQCSLAGAAGRCVEGGRCAYPNSQCPSGLAYPQGAPQGLAGECVPDDAVGSGTGGEPTATAEPGASEGAPGSDAETADGGTGSSGGDPSLCKDAHEPNDDELHASPIPFGAPRGCSASWEGALDDSVDADWFELDATDDACPQSVELTFATDSPLQLCALPRCIDESEAEIVACDGEVLPLASGIACCGLEQLRVLGFCGGVTPRMVLGIAPADDTAACLPYQAAAFL